MAHTSTVLHQLIKLLSRHEFEKLASQHHVGQRLRKISRWDQFVALLMSQLNGRQSLRDIEANINAQGVHHYHLGIKRISRSSLSRINENQPFSLYQQLFAHLLSKLQHAAPGHRFQFNHRLFSLDSSLIELSLKLFPWADHNRTKGAMKVHVGLDHAGLIPTFVQITDGRDHDVKIGRQFDFPKHSIVVFDKGYTDYKWYKNLTDKQIFFVSRQRSNAAYRVIKTARVDKTRGVCHDQLIELTGSQLRHLAMPTLRRIVYQDQDSGKEYVFITNHLELDARTVADLYKERWQVELFFKAMKQNLKIHAFVGRSRNAVMTQIWVAMCAYLMLCYLKLLSKTGWTEQRIMRVLQANLFTRQSLIALIKPSPPPDGGGGGQMRLIA